MSAQRRHPGPPNYYEILNLSLSAIEDAHAQGGTPLAQQLIKRAYRRALLSHHPDKQQNHSREATTKLTTTSQGATAPRNEYKYTIDQISQAYAILSSPSQRASYDRQLKLLHLNNDKTDQSIGGLEAFQTGIENVDLDDLEFEQEDQQDSQTKWYHPCRCGNPRGYLFSESDLEEASDLGELMVGCADCSLWLRVHFAVLEYEDDEDERTQDHQDRVRGAGQDGGGDGKA